MQNQRIRIRLRGYDSRVLDKSVLEIVETAKRTGAKVAGRFPHLEQPAPVHGAEANRPQAPVFHR